MRLNSYDVFETDSATGDRLGLIGSIQAESLGEARKAARAKWGLTPATRRDGRPTRGPSMEVVGVDAPTGEVFVSAVELAKAQLAKEQAEATAATHAADMAKLRAQKEVADAELAKMRLELEAAREKALKEPAPAPATGSTP